MLSHLKRQATFVNDDDPTIMTTVKGLSLLQQELNKGTGIISFFRTWSLLDR